MKIRQKLTLGFSVVAILIATAGYLYTFISQEVLHKEIGKGLDTFASDVLKDIDRHIYMRIETIQGYCNDRFLVEAVESSNKEFAKLPDIQTYIDAKDKQWISTPEDQMPEFMKELFENDLSRDLKKRRDFHELKYGYPVFTEAFVTNKYGVNISQDQRTIDYYQADELWWQQARQSGLYVGNAQYDKSSETYCLPICVRINDSIGDFVGVLKVALNIKDAYAFLGEDLPFNFKLLDKDNRVIYSTQTYTFLENLTGHYFYGQLLNNEGDVVPEKGNRRDHLETISLVYSTGYRDYRGAGWRLIVEHDLEDAFASVEKLKNWQLLFSCSVTLLSLILGVFLAKSISHPIDKLVKAARHIGKGNLDTVVEVNTKDETGLLADAFNRMVRDLKKSTTSIDELNTLNDQLQTSQKEIKDSNVKLKSEIVGRKRIQENLSFVNRELEKTVEKLGQSNQELQDFVYIASHDLREPLRKISSFGQLLQSSLQDDLSEDDLENFEFMIDGAKRMTEMIEALLVYSRLNTKGMDWGIADFNEIIDQFKHLEIATLIEETNASVTIPRQLPNVIADAPMIRQLMQNLIINGIKYRDDDVVPEIVITASDVDENTVKIQVSDNGIGIKQEMHEAIFKMFKRVHSRKKYEGAGIGLAVCKKIVEKHGGLIGVDSDEGQGSVFWFTIKKAKEAVLA